MATFDYFAYGSNMLTQRLVERCPSAEAVGLAIADGYDLEFSKRSIDKSGKATLVERVGCATHGVRFRIDTGERTLLDDFEGSGYTRIDDFSVTAAGDRMLVACYVAKDTVRNLRPYDWYLNLVLAGAKEHGLPGDYVSRLSQQTAMVDLVEGRPTRVAALKLLSSVTPATANRQITGA